MLKKPDVWLGPPGWQIVESTSSHRGAHVGGAHAVPFDEHDMFGCAAHAATSATSAEERHIVAITRAVEYRE